MSLIPPRRCHVCGTSFPHRHQSSCNLCEVRLGFLDSFSFWRRRRRKQRRAKRA